MGATSDIPTGRAIVALAALALTGCHGDDPCGPAQLPCKSEGRCFLEGKNCVAREDASCATSDTCSDEGRCRARDGRCAALDSADCHKSVACTRSGRCKAVEGFCVAGDVKDCENKAECRKGLCAIQGGACVVVRAPDNGDNKEGGCPCGCDHSEKMASELTKAPTTVAEAAIQRSLITIAEREDAGYITWAMVTHRRRLLASSQELLGITPGGRGVPLSAKPAVPVSALRIEGDGLIVRAQLVVHGETTEPVDGEDKGIRASFRLGLEISNASSRPRTISRPRLRGHAGFPVSTWYVLGSDGRPWDGELEPRQTRQLNAIGYLDEPLAPGTLAAAKVHLEGLRFEVKDVARAHWR